MSGRSGSGKEKQRTKDKPKAVGQLGAIGVVMWRRGGSPPIPPNTPPPRPMSFVFPFRFPFPHTRKTKGKENEGAYGPTLGGCCPLFPCPLRPLLESCLGRRKGHGKTTAIGGDMRKTTFASLRLANGGNSRGVCWRVSGLSVPPSNPPHRSLSLPGHFPFAHRSQWFGKWLGKERRERWMKLSTSCSTSDNLRSPLSFCPLDRR